MGECPCCKRDDEIERLKRYVGVLETVRGDASLVLTWLGRDATAALNWTDGKDRVRLLSKSVQDAYNLRAEMEKA